VSTCSRLRAVAVVDPDEGIGARRARRIERHQLIVGGSVRRSRRPRFFGVNCAAARAQVDNDDFVADSVHLHKGLIGESAHNLLCPGFACFIWRIDAEWPEPMVRYVTMLGNRRTAAHRRRTVMSPFKLALPVVFLAFAVADVPGVAQNSPAPPRPSASETMTPPAAGPASPSPLQPGDAF